MEYHKVVELIGDQKYLKELDLGDDKLFFYYNNKSTAEGGGVYVYRVDKSSSRPDKQNNLYNYLSSGKTTAFSGVPNYTVNLHHQLFGMRNALF